MQSCHFQAFDHALKGMDRQGIKSKLSKTRMGGKMQEWIKLSTNHSGCWVAGSTQKAVVLNQVRPAQIIIFWHKWQKWLISISQLLTQMWFSPAYWVREEGCLSAPHGWLSGTGEVAGKAHQAHPAVLPRVLSKEAISFFHYPWMFNLVW